MTDNEAVKLAVKMHREFNALNTDFDLEFVLIEDIWLRTGDDDSVYYNTDANKEDLLEYEGNTYGLETRFVKYEDDDYYLIYGDNGCGDKYYAMFLKINEVNEND